MALGSLRRDPSHQPAPVQSILDWRGAGSVFFSAFERERERKAVREEKARRVEETLKIRF